MTVDPEIAKRIANAFAAAQSPADIVHAIDEASHTGTFPEPALFSILLQVPLNPGVIDVALVDRIMAGSPPQLIPMLAGNDGMSAAATDHLSTLMGERFRTAVESREFESIQTLEGLIRTGALTLEHPAHQTLRDAMIGVHEDAPAAMQEIATHLVVVTPRLSEDILISAVDAIAANKWRDASRLLHEIAAHAYATEKVWHHMATNHAVAATFEALVGVEAARRTVSIRQILQDVGVEVAPGIKAQLLLDVDPKSFAAEFRALVRKDPNAAARLLKDASPEQQAPLEMADVSPLLSGGSHDARAIAIHFMRYRTTRGHIHAY